MYKKSKDKEEEEQALRPDSASQDLCCPLTFGVQQALCLFDTKVSGCGWLHKHERVWGFLRLCSCLFVCLFVCLAV